MSAPSAPPLLPAPGHLTVSNCPPQYRSVSELSGHYGAHGGRYIPETLLAAHEELEAVYVAATTDPAFREQLELLGRDFIGRDTPLYFAARLTAKAAEGAGPSGAAQIWLKREELAHTGSHKINNAIGQVRARAHTHSSSARVPLCRLTLSPAPPPPPCNARVQALLAKRIGKRRVIAETGAGQHGVATATACALLDLDCTVYMGAEDVERQALNVFRMKMLGATVGPVDSGSRTLKDAINEAMRDWVTNVRTTHYIVGSAIGPHPFPAIVRDFQSVIGREARAQLLARAGRLPSAVVCCIGGGSNAIGMFAGFREDAAVRLVGVEAGGEGLDSGRHSATLSAGVPGVLHGTRTYLLQDAHGQVTETHSISAGLDYPGVGPEHAALKDSGRAEYVAVTDAQALEGVLALSRCEGIIPALEPAHAVFHAMRLARELGAKAADGSDNIVLVNMCERAARAEECVQCDAARVAQIPPPPALPPPLSHPQAAAATRTWARSRACSSFEVEEAGGGARARDRRVGARELLLLNT